MIGQVEFDLQLAEIVLLNPYLDRDSPKVDEWDEAWREKTIAAQAIVDYSVEVVRVGRYTTGKESVSQVIPLIQELYDSIRVLPPAGPYIAEIDAAIILRQAAQQNNMTKALRSAAPVSIISLMRSAVSSSTPTADSMPHSPRLTTRS